jgi:hypothetical protein
MKLYPWNKTSMKKINNELSMMDWKKLRWDYENGTSCHNLKDDPSMKLWLNPLRFVLGGTE